MHPYNRRRLLNFDKDCFLKLKKTYAATIIYLLCCGAQAADLTLNTPRLQGMDNFRDVAGTTTAYTTANDGVMRQGVFYRANAITPTASDLAVLNTLNIATVVDLRTPEEIATTPDTLPAGAKYVNVDLIGNSGSTSSITSTLANLDAAGVNAMMEDGERSFVTSNYARQGLNEVFRELAEADGAALFHCTAGKDRTGWTAAILQSIAGVSSADIMQNYLATNEYTAARINATVAALPPSMAETYRTLMGVQANWLQAGFDQILLSYGTVDNYLKKGLGLDQATIYVLRAKMVRYSQLPGQESFTGNAAAGAAFLNALQDSPLSGRYTAYNFALQSAIDSGSLGGLEKRIGGQIYADTASYLLRAPSQINDKIAPWIAGNTLAVGSASVWMTGMDSYLGTEGNSAQSSSNEHSAGAVVGSTWRANEQLSVNGGIGYSHGNVSSNGDEVKTNSTFITLGGRYALNSLQDGPYSTLQGTAGYIDYDSERHPGSGFGSAKGDSNGQFYSARAGLGWFVPGIVSFDPSLGVQVTHLHLEGVQESDSEVALDVDGTNETQTSLVSNLDIKLKPFTPGSWALTPGINIGYERLLSDEQQTSHASLYGINVDQVSAYNSKNLYKAGINLSATSGNLTLAAGANVLAADRSSSGFNGTLSASYAF